MTTEHFAGRVLAFKGEDEYSAGEVLAEVTDVQDGDVELAFNLPGTKIRVYLSVSLAEVVRRSMRGDKE